MRGVLHHEEPLVLRGGAAVDLLAVAVRAEPAGLVADHDQQRPGEQLLRVEERVPADRRRATRQHRARGTARALSPAGLVVVRGLQHVDVRQPRLPPGLDRGRQEVVDPPIRAACLGGALRRHLLQSADRVVAAERLAAEAPEVDAGDAGDGLDPAVGHGRVDDVAATAADPDPADAVRIDVRQRHEVIDRDADVLHALRGIVDQTRLPAALTLVTGVEDQHHVAGFRQRLRVHVAGGLFLAAADRVNAHDRRIGAVLVEIRGEVEDSRQVPGHPRGTEAHTLGPFSHDSSWLPHSSSSGPRAGACRLLRDQLWVPSIEGGRLRWNPPQRGVWRNLAPGPDRP